MAFLEEGMEECKEIDPMTPEWNKDPPDDCGECGQSQDLSDDFGLGKYIGGSYGEIRKYVQDVGDLDVEVHHMPADSVSPLERLDGPAIEMDREDHRLTASCGNSMEAREYRAAQKERIDTGDFRGAMQMDIDDVHEKFGEKYDDQIDEMLVYVDQLEMEGKI